MQLFIRKVRAGEVLNASLRTRCTPETLDLATERARGLYCSLPPEYVDFLALHNGFHCGDITLYYFADPGSAEEILKDPKTPAEFFQANEVCHSRGLKRRWVSLGECNLGLFVYDSDKKEYVVIDPAGLDEFDAYDSLEDMVMDMIDPEYFGDEDDEDEE